MSLFAITVLVCGLMGLGWLGCGIVTAQKAMRRGGGIVQWILLGILLGPVGLYIVFRFLDHKCPDCRSPILRGIRLCPICNAEIPRLENNPVGPMWTYRRDW